MKFLKKAWLSLVGFMLPIFAFAQATYTGAGCEPGKLCNPLRGIDSLSTLVIKLLDAVILIGGYVAALFIIWSGFLFVKARGNPTELEAAKKTFWYTIIGVAILLGAKAIALAIQSTINSIVG